MRNHVSPNFYDEKHEILMALHDEPCNLYSFNLSRILLGPKATPDEEGIYKKFTR
jgi:hypothetical protein